MAPREERARPCWMAQGRERLCWMAPREERARPCWMAQGRERLYWMAPREERARPCWMAQGRDAPCSEERMELLTLYRASRWVAHLRAPSEALWALADFLEPDAQSTAYPYGRASTFWLPEPFSY
jgi:hypothetical protein